AAPCSRSQAPPRSTLLPYTTLFRSPLARRVRHRLFRLPVVFLVGGLLQPLDVAAEAHLHLNEAFVGRRPVPVHDVRRRVVALARSEEHTSELQSRVDLVCRLLLKKK